MRRLIPLLTAALLVVPGIASAMEDAIEEPDVTETHSRDVRNAWIWFGAGAGLTTGGVLTLLAGRGNAGAISSETSTMAEARSVLGAGVTIAGLTTLLVGTVKLEQAWDGRDGKGRHTRLSLAPLPAPRTTGLSLTVRR